MNSTGSKLNTRSIQVKTIFNAQSTQPRALLDSKRHGITINPNSGFALKSGEETTINPNSGFSLKSGKKSTINPNSGFALKSGKKSTIKPHTWFHRCTMNIMHNELNQFTTQHENNTSQDIIQCTINLTSGFAWRCNLCCFPRGRDTTINPTSGFA